MDRVDDAFGDVDAGRLPRKGPATRRLARAGLGVAARPPRERRRHRSAAATSRLKPLGPLGFVRAKTASAGPVPVDATSAGSRSSSPLEWAISRYVSIRRNTAPAAYEPPDASRAVAAAPPGPSVGLTVWIPKAAARALDVAGERLRLRRALGVVIVLQDDQQRQLPLRGDVQRLVDRSLAERAVADEHHGDRVASRGASPPAPARPRPARSPLDAVAENTPLRKGAGCRHGRRRPPLLAHHLRDQALDIARPGQEMAVAAMVRENDVPVDAAPPRPRCPSTPGRCRYGPSRRASPRRTGSSSRCSTPRISIARARRSGKTPLCAVEAREGLSAFESPI